MLPFSIISNTEVKIPTGQSLFSGTSLSTTFIVPPSVKSICAVCVGIGQYGGGGLSYTNHIPVSAGEVLNIVIDGNSTRIMRGTDNLCIAGAGGGGAGGAGGLNMSTVNSGGGNGGSLYNYFDQNSDLYRLGGGAGGYSGNGGTASGSGTNVGSSGQGGGGGSGSYLRSGNSIYSTAAGGVGVYGEGASGAPGQPGSGGNLRNYGGGNTGTMVASPGAVRIIWGKNREFPKTNTADM